MAKLRGAMALAGVGSAGGAGTAGSSSSMTLASSIAVSVFSSRSVAGRERRRRAPV